MKHLTGLNDKVQPVDVGDPLPEVAYTNQAAFKKLFRLALVSAKGNAERSLEQYDLNTKLAGVDNEVDLEDAEYKLLVDCVKQNPAELMPYFLAQVIRKLQEAA